MRGVLADRNPEADLDEIADLLDLGFKKGAPAAAGRRGGANPNRDASGHWARRGTGDQTGRGGPKPGARPTAGARPAPGGKPAAGTKPVAGARPGQKPIPGQKPKPGAPQAGKPGQRPPPGTGAARPAQKPTAGAQAGKPGTQAGKPPARQAGKPAAGKPAAAATPAAGGTTAPNLKPADHAKLRDALSLQGVSVQTAKNAGAHMKALFGRAPSNGEVASLGATAPGAKVSVSSFGTPGQAGSGVLLKSDHKGGSSSRAIVQRKDGSSELRVAPKTEKVGQGQSPALRRTTRRLAMRRTIKVAKILGVGFLVLTAAQVAVAGAIVAGGVMGARHLANSPDSPFRSYDLRKSDEGALRDYEYKASTGVIRHEGAELAEQLLFGHSLSGTEAASLFGVTKDARIDLAGYGKAALAFSADLSDQLSVRGAVGPSKDGDGLLVEISSVGLPDGEKGDILAPILLRRLVLGGAEVGATTLVARAGSFGGSALSLARLGFDAQITDPTMRGKTCRDLLTSFEGRSYLQSRGHPDMTFDLDAGSESRRLLAARLRAMLRSQVA